MARTTLGSILCVLMTCAPVRAQTHPMASRELFGEQEIKAAFIFNFAKFVTWPPPAFPEADTPFVICAWGDDPLVRTLGSLEGARIQGRSISVRQYRGGEIPKTCHILLVGTSEESRLGEILPTVRSESHLTISEIEGFAQAGGIINLVTKDNKVRFEINLEAAKRAGLQISSQLLTLARIVKEKQR